MNSISTWLLSIAGIVILGVIAEFVLPEGQMNKYIKVIFSFMTLLVIIMPLPRILGNEFKLNDYFKSSESVLQEDYLYQVNLDKLTALNEDISKDINSLGLKNVVVSINANILSDQLEIFGVFVDLCDIEYQEKFGSNDITTAKIKINEIINSYSILKNVEVKYNEQD